MYGYHPLTGWLGFTLLHNTGAAFSFLSGGEGWQRWVFIAVAIIMMFTLLGWMKTSKSHEILKPVLTMLIFGGAAGNLIDRIMHGYVVDFILFHYKTWYFPVFNLADTAITVGAILFIARMILEKKK